MSIGIMITIKLWGGLGNQLFQYAYGYQMAKKLETGIVLDTSWFYKQNLRSPDILQFNIKYDCVEQLCKFNKKIGVINKQFINRSIRVLGVSRFKLGKYNYLKETRYRYGQKFASYALDNTFLDGYWQCPLYFEQVKNDLLQMYTINNLSEGVLELGEELRSQDSVAVHVRRGDYPKKKTPFSRFVSLGEEYYKKAVECLLDKIDSPSFYIFSNDMQDALDMLNPSISGFIKKIGLKTNYLDEWYLMKCCRHQIIGNSSFSWWPAYLNGYEKKMVVAPKKYLGNDNILCDNWIQIDF